MEEIALVLYIGTIIFALNGLVMVGMISRVERFERRAKEIEARLQKLNLRMRRRR